MGALINAANRRPPTLRDVARQANVSLSTASKIINGTKRFSGEVEQRVRAAVAQLDFRPNPHARGIVTGRTNALGIVILDIANPYYAAVVKGASQVAARRDYTLLLADAEESPNRELSLVESLAVRCDGLLLAGSRLSDDAIRRIAGGIPTVVLGRICGGNALSVVTNECEIAFQLARHLLMNGRKRVIYLAGPPFWVNRERRRGIWAAAAEVGVKPAELSLPEPTLQAGEMVAPSLLLGSKRPDAVIAYNDLAALGLLRAAGTLGVRVPEDVAVAGFGDIPFAGLANPPLTTAAAPSIEMGDRATTALLDRLTGKSIPRSPIVIPSHLVVRGSTGLLRTPHTQRGS
jgi:LacI family transcriptional regulator, galactose operon repressor